MKYYAVIDTNVLVSAMLKWDSVPGNVLELAFSGVIVPLLNEAKSHPASGVVNTHQVHFIIGKIHHKSLSALLCMAASFWSSA